jgi:hypothetical protein
MSAFRPQGAPGLIRLGLAPGPGTRVVRAGATKCCLEIAPAGCGCGGHSRRFRSLTRRRSGRGTIVADRDRRSRRT